MSRETENLGLIARTIRRRIAEVRIEKEIENVLVLGIKEEQPSSLVTLGEEGKTLLVSTDELNALIMNVLIGRGWRRRGEDGLDESFRQGDLSEEFSKNDGSFWEEVTYYTGHADIFFVRTSRLREKSGRPIVSSWRVKREERSLVKVVRDMMGISGPG